MDQHPSFGHQNGSARLPCFRRAWDSSSIVLGARPHCVRCTMEARCLVPDVMGCAVLHWVSFELHDRPGITQTSEQSKNVDDLRFNSAYAGMLISLLRTPGLQ